MPSSPLFPLDTTVSVTALGVSHESVGASGSSRPCSVNPQLVVAVCLLPLFAILAVYYHVAASTMTCQLTRPPCRFRDSLIKRARQLKARAGSPQATPEVAPVIPLLANLAITMPKDQKEVVVIDDDEPMELNDVNYDPNGSQHIQQLDNDIRAECRQAALGIFPDICPVFLEELATKHSHDPERLVTAILDLHEKGNPLPKRERVNLKRKRDSEDVGDPFHEQKKKYDNEQWRLKVKASDYAAAA
jgi:hypothetical protein